MARPVLNLGWLLATPFPTPFGFSIRPLLVAAACLVAIALAPRRAAAQDEGTSWRRTAPPPESPQHFAYELRFGPYHPNIDNDFPDSRPYEHAFGVDKHQFYLGLEFDWQLLRIPHLGSLGPGLGWGYTATSATATLVSDPTKYSGDATNLRIMPMYGVAVLRVDVLARETGIPLVGYAKAGLGYGLWWTGNDRGVQGKGHTWGTQFALGGMLLIDVFDQHAAIELDNEWGINNTYYYIEWMKAGLDGFGQSGDHAILNIGTSTWVMGLAMEL